MLGVRANGRKEVVAVTDGYREVLRVVGGRRWCTRVLEGAAGSVPQDPGAALLVPLTSECACCAPEAGASRCARGNGGHPQGRRHRQAQLAIAAFASDWGAKYPKAVAKITDADLLLEYFKYPARALGAPALHTIEFTFATVRLRTKVTKVPGSRAAGVAMAYKLIEAAQARWPTVKRYAPGRAQESFTGFRQRWTDRTLSVGGRVGIPVVHARD